MGVPHLPTKCIDCTDYTMKLHTMEYGEEMFWYVVKAVLYEESKSMPNNYDGSHGMRESHLKAWTKSYDRAEGGKIYGTDKNNPYASPRNGANAHQTTVCLMPGTLYKLVQIDTYGDGWHGGWMELVGTGLDTSGTHLFANGGNRNFEKTYDFTIPYTDAQIAALKT